MDSSVYAEVTQLPSLRDPEEVKLQPQLILKTQYVDKQGYEWSSILSNQYTNGCTSYGDGEPIHCENKKEIDSASAAYLACSKRGWRLPSREDWDRLIKEFDSKKHALGFSLTRKGQADFNKKFETRKGDMYASSTVSGSNRHSHAFAFSTYWSAEQIIKSIEDQSLGESKETFSGRGRYEPQSVICVRSSIPSS